MKKVIILTLSLISLSSVAKNINCSGEDYVFSVNDNQATIKSSNLSLDVDVKQTGSNYSGVVGQEGFYAFRFILKGQEGELKLIGHRNVIKKLKCVIH